VAKKRKASSEARAAKPLASEVVAAVPDDLAVAPALDWSVAGWRLFIVVGVGVAMATLAVFHVRWVNGPWYWEWLWRRLTWGVYPLVAVASLPAFAAHALYSRGRIGPRGAVALLMLATFAMQMAITVAQPPGVGRIVKAVEDPTNTSYYTVAALMDAQERASGLGVSVWLAAYPEIMHTLMLHASYKPPGWTLYYLAWIKVFGLGPAAATAGAIGVALMASGGVAATYALMRTFALPRDAAVLAAAFFAMTPSLVLFFPQGDQTYPLLGCLMIVAWTIALRRPGRDGMLAAAVFGAMLALGLFFSAVFLMYGVILAVLTILAIADDPTQAGFVRAAERCLIAVVTIGALYLALFFATNFDPIATFQTAAARSQADLVKLQRPWPLHSALDIADIILGTGWISAPLIAWGAWATWRRLGWRSPVFRLVFLGMLNVLTAVAVAVFPGENARLMLPLTPLLMAPIGIELARWPARARTVAFATLVLVTCAIGQNMTFLNVDPNYHFQLNLPQPGQFDDVPGEVVPP
jgi:hypothetical protein